MSPHSVAPPPADEPRVGEAKSRGAQARVEAPARQKKGQREIFVDALLELAEAKPKRRVLDFFVSLVVHTLFISTLILVPLYFTEAIDLKQFTQTFLVAPPPPPPPPPPAAPAVVKIAPLPKKVFMQSGKLVAPPSIPEKVAMLREDQMPDVGGGIGVPGGVPGGVAGGQYGGVIGGIISSSPKTFIPVAPPSGPKAPIRVGGRVKAPRPISMPDPIYPALAKQARLQGDVVIDAVIDPQGNVVEMQVVSGHPLLIPAAMEALRKWKYQPTFLNEEPVSVQLLVTIKFRLG